MSANKKEIGSDKYNQGNLATGILKSSWAKNTSYPTVIFGEIRGDDIYKLLRDEEIMGNIKKRCLDSIDEYRLFKQSIKRIMQK